ncbi:MAG: response regulator transcription factor [Proteobacteria bacterium]|nr:MAG: response regulator transcription factor [Pseudomonadota bacterium]
MRILLADAHTMVREGLRLLLSAQRDMIVVGETGNLETVWRQVKKLRPHVLIIDVSVWNWEEPKRAPLASPLEIVERVRYSYPEVHILALFPYLDNMHINSTLAAGVDGLLLKRSNSQQLLEALNTIALGSKYIDAQIRGRQQSFRISAGHKYPNSDVSEFNSEENNVISNREREVLKRLALGYGNQETADFLGISVKTVEGHKQKIKEKIGLTSRAMMVKYALRRGWLGE